MISTLLPLKIKIIAGYVTLVLILLVLLTLIYREHKQLVSIDKRAEKALVLREQAEEITLDILNLAQLGEKVITWKEKDIAVYTKKQNNVTILLYKLQEQKMD